MIDRNDNFDRITLIIYFATFGVAPKLVLSAKAGGKYIKGLRKEAFAFSYNLLKHKSDENLVTFVFR